MRGEDPAEDNGAGFLMADVMLVDDSLRGMGFSSMRERIALVGGKLTISSAEGEGTTVHATLPVKKQESA